MAARYTPLVFAPGRGGLLADQVDALLALVADADEVAAQVGMGPGRRHDPETRTSAVSWLALTAATSWLFSRLYTLAVRGAEQGGWAFELQGPEAKLQYTRYRSSDEGHYGWHVDLGAPTSPERKVSVAIQLSGPDEYDGGELELLTGGEPWRAPRERGCAVVFPSFVVHRVTPVHAGERHSLVSWILGPPLR